MVKLYVRNMLAGVGRWQLTCAEVSVATSAIASEAEVDYQMDAAAHAERP